MMTFRGRFLDVSNVIGRLAGAEDKIWAGAGLGAQRGLALGETIVKRHQSGRPGPNVITGDFRRRTKWDADIGRRSIEGQIGNDSPQGPRLEYPFYGPDSLGRMFPGTTYPSFEPSTEAVAEAVVSHMNRGVQAAVKAL